jgi:mannose-6-phosphate isomerase-like protein (cupin superfamily)
MEKRQLSAEEMEGALVRFDDVLAQGDDVLSVIATAGSDAGEGARRPGPRIGAPHEFDLAFLRAPSSQVARSRVESVEVLMAVDGACELLWGEGDAESAVLEACDIAVLPAGLERGVSSCGEQPVQVLSVRGNAAFIDKLPEGAPRIVRFKDLAPSTQGFIDSRIEGYERKIFTALGPGVTDSSDASSAISEAYGFNLSFVECDHGKGPVLHRHPTSEVFVPMTGRWRFVYNDDESGAVEVGPGDVLSVPIGVMRRFVNLDEEPALVFVVIGGNDPGTIEFPDEILDQARETGFVFDDDGRLVDLTR